MAYDECSPDNDGRVITGTWSDTEDRVRNDCSRFVASDEVGVPKRGGRPGCTLPAVTWTWPIERNDGCTAFWMGALDGSILLTADDKDIDGLAAVSGCLVLSTNVRLGCELNSSRSRTLIEVSICITGWCLHTMLPVYNVLLCPPNADNGSIWRVWAWFGPITDSWCWDAVQSSDICCKFTGYMSQCSKTKVEFKNTEQHIHQNKLPSSVLLYEKNHIQRCTHDSSYYFS